MFSSVVHIPGASYKILPFSARGRIIKSVWQDGGSSYFISQPSYCKEPSKNKRFQSSVILKEQLITKADG